VLPGIGLLLTFSEAVDEPLAHTQRSILVHAEVRCRIKDAT